MIVIPERSRALIVVVMRRRGARQPAGSVACLEHGPEGVVPRAHRRIAVRDVRGVREEPRFRVAITLLARVRTMDVRHPRHRARVGILAGAVHVAPPEFARGVGPVQGLVDRQQVRQVAALAVDELVPPLNASGAVRSRLDCEGRRERASGVVDRTETPHRRLRQWRRQDRLPQLADGDAIDVHLAARARGGHCRRHHERRYEPGDL
jgi:hypothetical protein